jgi:hypothetical protein
MTTNAKKQPSDSWAHDRAGWAGRAIHRAELWSGMRILFRFPTLGELIATGELPERLLELALLEYGDPGRSYRLIGAQAEQALDEQKSDEERQAAKDRADQFGRDLATLNRELCALALVEPKLTAEELSEVPLQDLEMLAGFINRTVVMDAAGRRIGIEPLDTFRQFRDKHGCGEDCQACEATRRDLSTVHLGGV